MKVKGWMVPLVIAGLVMLGGGPASATDSEGYLYQQHDCWIGKTHYGARTIIQYYGDHFWVTLQTYQTSPGAKAHRVQWVADGRVQYAMGHSRKSKNDVPEKAKFYPVANFEKQNMIFTVWDGKAGHFCRDDTPETGPA